VARSCRQDSLTLCAPVCPLVIPGFTNPVILELSISFSGALNEGASKNEVIRAGVKALQSNELWNHLLLWNAFVLVGGPASLEGTGVKADDEAAATR